MILGTGVGGGVISLGVLLRGVRGIGGELGRITVQPADPRCGCANRGCPEALASGTAIARRARKVAKELPDSALGGLAVKRAPRSGKTCSILRARSSDEDTVKVL